MKKLKAAAVGEIDRPQYWFGGLDENDWKIVEGKGSVLTDSNDRVLFLFARTMETFNCAIIHILYFTVDVTHIQRHLRMRQQVICGANITYLYFNLSRRFVWMESETFLSTSPGDRA